MPRIELTPLPSWTPLLACLAPLCALIPIILSGKKPNLREGWSFAAAILLLGLVLSLIPQALAGKQAQCVIWPLAPGAPLAFAVDGLGLLFALVASSLWIVTTLYSVGYMRGVKASSQTRFYVYFAISLSATIGVAFAANLLTLYIFYELLSLATYPLVTHNQNRSSRSGGRKYLSYLLGASIGLALPAILFIYAKTGGEMDFSSTGFLQGHITRGEAVVLLLLLLFGFAKAGLMPFHSWLPAAMVAPTPVSALLHAVAVVKVGVFCVARVINGVFGADYLQSIELGALISWIAGFTVIVSSLLALTQDNLKRRLAFSTIGQLAYITLGLSLLNANGTVGGVIHIAMHAFGKITLFFAAGAIFVASGKNRISQLAGIGRSMPLTMSLFFVGAMSVIGLPPTGGFISKLHMAIGAVEAGRIWILAIYLVSTLLNAAYLLPIVYQAFFRPSEAPGDTGGIREAPACCIAAMAVTSCLALLAFFQGPWFKALAGLVAP